MHTSCQFKELHRKKEEIEESSLALMTEYEHQKKYETAIRITEEEVKAATSKKKLNSRFKTTQTVKKWITVKTDRHNTLCGAKDCYSNCHISCSLTKSFEKSTFRGCGSMRGGTCRKCGHSHDLHYHNEVIFKLVTEEIEMIDHETRQQFEAAKDMEKSKDILLKGLEDEKMRSIHKRRDISVKMFVKIIEFESMGISANYSKFLENQIAVIKQRLEEEFGDEASDLRQVLMELEERLTVVRQAIK